MFMTTEYMDNNKWPLVAYYIVCTGKGEWTRKCEFVKNNSLRGSISKLQDTDANVFRECVTAY